MQVRPSVCRHPPLHVLHACRGLAYSDACMQLYRDHGVVLLGLRYVASAGAPPSERYCVDMAPFHNPHRVGPDSIGYILSDEALVARDFRMQAVRALHCTAACWPAMTGWLTVCGNQPTLRRLCPGCPVHRPCL